ncbi:protein-(glutamine-N5) methyltransferase, release factor-specific, partial [Patescibacteria group bacterium]|nr:protein-(glutamine-N5) methyltransferase, release factor-specific [Patescibacteria group bacterium]
MTIKQALIRASKKLEAKKITSADLDAEVLLTHVLRKPREYLFTHPEANLSTYQLTNFNKLITRRSKHEPVA